MKPKALILVWDNGHIEVLYPKHIEAFARVFRVIKDLAKVALKQ